MKIHDLLNESDYYEPLEVRRQRSSLVTNFQQAIDFGFAVMDKRTHNIVPATIIVGQKRARLDVPDDLQHYVVVSVTTSGVTPQTDWSYNYS